MVGHLSAFPPKPTAPEWKCAAEITSIRPFPNAKRDRKLQLNVIVRNGGMEASIVEYWLTLEDGEGNHAICKEASSTGIFPLRHISPELHGQIAFFLPETGDLDKVRLHLKDSLGNHIDVTPLRATYHRDEMPRYGLPRVSRPGCWMS